MTADYATEGPTVETDDYWAKNNLTALSHIDRIDLDTFSVCETLCGGVEMKQVFPDNDTLDDIEPVQGVLLGIPPVDTDPAVAPAVAAGIDNYFDAYEASLLLDFEHFIPDDCRATTFEGVPSIVGHHALKDTVEVHGQKIPVNKDADIHFSDFTIRIAEDTRQTVIL